MRSKIFLSTLSFSNLICRHKIYGLQQSDDQSLNRTTQWFHIPTPFAPIIVAIFWLILLSYVLSYHMIRKKPIYYLLKVSGLWTSCPGPPMRSHQAFTFTKLTCMQYVSGMMVSGMMVSCMYMHCICKFIFIFNK